MISPYTSHIHRKQGGVVLIIALALLVVIGLSSAFILRNALFGDLLSNNLAASQAANHAAEVALRFCEAQVINPTAGAIPSIRPIPEELEATEWQTAANWNDNARVVNVPAALLKSSDTGAVTLNYNRAPQCMIERPWVKRDPQNPRRDFAFQITARGYSPGYQAATTNTNGAGAEVTLQSTLRMPTCSTALAQEDCPP